MTNVKTTVIGSYPIKIDNMDLIRSYFSQKNILWKNYIKTAVKDMVDAGIHIIADGQIRDPFVNIFTRKLKGCRVRERTEIIDKIEYKNQITINDQEYVKSLIPKDRLLLGLITGPYTLTKSSIDLFYNNEKEIAFDFAKALNKEARILQKKVDIISIDEPFFSMGIPEYGNDLIKTVKKGISGVTRLHCCGNVTDVIPQLLDLPIDILSCEFKAQPKLFDEFKKYNISKKICLGCVRSDRVEIENVEEVKNHIKRGIDVFGEKIEQLSPDCGLKMLPRDVAYQKLKNLVKAYECVYER